MNLFRNVMGKPTPCDDCNRRQSCKENLLACHAFALFVNDGRIENRASRMPTRAIYAQVMWYDNDEALIRNIFKQLRKEFVK